MKKAMMSGEAPKRAPLATSRPNSSRHVSVDALALSTYAELR